MFYLLAKGKKRRFTRGEVLGGKRVAAIWKGMADGSMVKIWPSGNVARRIRVQLPEEGSIEWAYWVHALDSLAKNACTTQNYMRFGTSEGFFYYLQKSYDGSAPYVLDGSVLELELGDDGVSIDELGTHISVQAKIPRREWVQQYETEEMGVSPDDDKTALPYITNSSLKCSIHKGRKKKGIGCDTYVYASPGGQLLTEWHYGTHEHKRGWKSKGFIPMTEDKVWDGSEKWQKGYADMYEGATGMLIHQEYQMNLTLSEVAFQFPAFTKTFKLKIISVE